MIHERRPLLWDPIRRSRKKGRQWMPTMPSTTGYELPNNASTYLEDDTLRRHIGTYLLVIVG